MKDTYQKLESIHCSIQEALNGNIEELTQALELVEDLREKEMEDEYFVVDFGSASISFNDYKKIVRNELSWEEWIKDNPPQIDRVLTEDGQIAYEVA
tara:strand:+ start:387 stop:677 length:291 start_codon:yes stop_codon:yes gene_type:complete